MTLNEFLTYEKELLKNYFIQSIQDGYSDGGHHWLTKHDNRLINMILSIVKEQVDKKYERDLHLEKGIFYIMNSEYNQALDDVVEIINKLRV